MMMEPNNTILHGDALSVLRGLPDECVQMVCTSPPYYGLRDYQTESIIWDGDSECEHEWGEAQRTPWANEVPGPNGRKKNPAASHLRAKETGPFCQSCGAWKGSLGLEPTLPLYVQHLVQIFHEARRVLRSDGVLWLNLGDSFGTGTKAVRVAGNRGIGSNTQAAQDAVPRVGGMAKQLMMIPARVAIALQEDGWYLRSDIIWHKTNAMPESVTDRPTSAHEHVFLLAKSESYFYDARAIAEPSTSGHPSGNGFARDARLTYKNADGTARGNEQQWQLTPYRNKRNVWTINTQPFPEEHWATFPPKLAETCILAGSRPGDVVLDPFMGAGTTAMMAIQHYRDWLGIELDPKAIRIAEKRIATVQTTLWEMGAD